MSNDGWIQHQGPELTRRMLKKFGFLGDLILPKDAEPCVNLVIEYPKDVSPSSERSQDESSVVGRGNVILPHITKEIPSIRFHLGSYWPTPGPHASYLKRSIPKLISLFLIDCDFPNIADSRVGQCFLWGQANIRSDVSEHPKLPSMEKPASLIKVDSTTVSEVGVNLFPYFPPHPQRGSDFHRYLFVLLGHAEPLVLPTSPCVSDESADNMYKKGPLNIYEKRLIDLSSVLGANEGCDVLATQWFLSTWTRAVTDIHRHILKAPEVAFGTPVTVQA
jgi:hypothetical protein